MNRNPHAESNDHEELIRFHQRQLRGYILVICPNHFAAEDILQETNRVLWEKRDDFQPGTNFLAWARTIARFQTMSFLKNRKSKSWLSFDSDLVSSLAKTVELRDDQKQLREDSLNYCVAALPQSDKELIRLRYEMQLSLKQISKKTGRTEGGLKQAFMRIRQALRECVELKTLQDE